VLPGSKATRDDLAWFRDTGLAAAVETSGAAVVAVCAGLQMAGLRIDDPAGVEGPRGTVGGLGWLPVTTRFEAAKVLDRPSALVVDGPGVGRKLEGYRIHHGRVRGGADARPWLVEAGGPAIGWWTDRVAGTSLHGLFEDDGLRADVLRWAATRAGVAPPDLPGAAFAAARQARLDGIADALEAHLDLDRLLALVAT
jgi:adenosylcobyric acid synthase